MVSQLLLEHELGQDLERSEDPPAEVIGVADEAADEVAPPLEPFTEGADHREVELALRSEPQLYVAYIAARTLDGPLQADPAIMRFLTGNKRAFAAYLRLCGSAVQRRRTGIEPA